MGSNRPDRHGRDMTSLHITHTVHDFDAWYAAFQEHADLRDRGGVTGTTVRRGADDRNQVAVDLGFDSRDGAGAFLARLEREIWPGSTHLSSTPTALLLDVVGVQEAATP